MMKINHIKITGAFALMMASVSVWAQEPLDDKKAQKIDLGWGVEQSQFLSTASTYTISGDELRQSSATSLADALHAKLLGLTAIKNGGFVGEEGNGPSFTLRGYKSNWNHDILILVDGYERPIDRLTVDEVESVTVLKDAAAVAMLGHEAINGVIMVKTKRGYEGPTEINIGYAHKFTFDPEFAPMLDGYSYAAALNKALANDELAPRYTQAELDLFQSGADPYFYPNVDWKKEALRNMGSENRANLSVAGGNEKVKYYTLMDYTAAKGLLKNTKQDVYDSQLKYSKANIRANVDFALSQTTKMKVNVLGVFMETNQPAWSISDAITWSIYTTPASAFPVKTVNGIWGGNETYTDRNVVAHIQGSGFRKTHQRQLWADAKIVQDLSFWVDGLSISMAASYDNASIIQETKGKSYMYGFDRYTGTVGDKTQVEEVTYGDNQANLGWSDGVTSQWRIGNGAFGAHYNTSFRDDDNFAASVVYNLKKEVRDGRNNTFNRINWLGSFHYDLQNKYVVDLTLGANGSNRSYPAKWAFSPTLALGYIFADNSDGVLNYGKVRASAGILHTDYVPMAGMWLASWDASFGSFVYGTNFQSGWGAFLQAFPVTNFSQERSLFYNLGTELRLLNSLDITAELFYQQRSHIMLPAQTENSMIVGIPSLYSDVGGVRSYGFELGARYSKKIGQNLLVNASAMVSWGRNEWTNYIGEPEFPGLDYVGNRTQESYGLEAIGFFADEADIAASPRQEFSQVKPGDLKYKDQNNDNVINYYDVIALGKSTGLPELNYGFTLGAEWKGIGVNATFQGASNYFMNLRAAGVIWGGLADNGNLSVDYYNNSWDVVTDKSKAKFPRLTTQSNTNNNIQSTAWMKELYFLKLRYCELYWKLPTKWVEKARLGGVKVFVQGQNLWGIDNVKAMDAEVLNTNYPVLKAVNLGASISF